MMPATLLKKYIKIIFVLVLGGVFKSTISKIVRMIKKVF